MKYFTDIFNTIVTFQQTNGYVDLIVILLILLGGYFAKQYLVMLNWNNALKTLLVGTVAVVLYTIILKYGEKSIEPTYWKKAFISYCIATSLYEIILKHVIVGLGILWGNLVDRLKGTKQSA